ncbi:hypothetical protein C4553_02310 [Candidatus Parcubacteria bacterium]|nr:MAG: hypothetical protein C4553_02310 [Candidatus Parcubacteria bacterium]
MEGNFSPERRQAAKAASEAAAAKRAEITGVEAQKTKEETKEPTTQEKVEAGKVAEQFLRELEDNNK